MFPKPLRSLEQHTVQALKMLKLYPENFGWRRLTAVKCEYIWTFGTHRD